jgi:hypothetical protein
MTNTKFLQEKIALLTVVLNHLNDAEDALDRLEALETSIAEIPDHDALSISDLIDDSIMSTMDLLKKCEDELEKTPPTFIGDK